MGPDLRAYLVAQLPGWIVAGLIAGALYRWTVLPAWLALTLFAAWLLKDLILFPFMRRFYRSEPASRRIVGLRGTAVTPLDPGGLVRVRGELWQAVSEQRIPQGAEIRVRDIHGLTLEVGIEASTGGASR